MPNCVFSKTVYAIFEKKRNNEREILIKIIFPKFCVCTQCRLFIICVIHLPNGNEETEPNHYRCMRCTRKRALARNDDDGVFVVKIVWNNKMHAKNHAMGWFVCDCECVCAHVSLSLFVSVSSVCLCIIVCLCICAYASSR